MFRNRLRTSAFILFVLGGAFGLWGNGVLVSALGSAGSEAREIRQVLLAADGAMQAGSAISDRTMHLFTHLWDAKIYESMISMMYSLVGLGFFIGSFICALGSGGPLVPSAPAVVD